MNGSLRGDRGGGRMRGERGSGSVRANANQVFCKMCCVLCFYGLLGAVLETSIYVSTPASVAFTTRATALKNALVCV